MALANYTDLLASVAGWLNRTNLTAVIPDFVTMAEAKISRDMRLRKQITTSTLSTTGGVRYIALPSDWLEFENITVAGNPDRNLSYATVEQLDVRYPSSDPAGVPVLYTIEGDQLIFGPTPDATYTVTALYFARFGALATNSTNWLMTNHPSTYLYACLYYGFLYIGNKQRAQDYLALYEKATTELQEQDDRAQHSGSVLRIRIV
jgi:hypothetical protein